MPRARFAAVITILAALGCHSGCCTPKWPSLFPHGGGVTLRGGLDFRTHRKPSGFVELIDTAWDEEMRIQRTVGVIHEQHGLLHSFGSGGVPGALHEPGVLNAPPLPSAPSGPGDHSAAGEHDPGCPNANCPIHSLDPDLSELNETYFPDPPPKPTETPAGVPPDDTSGDETTGEAPPPDAITNPPGKTPPANGAVAPSSSANSRIPAVSTHRSNSGDDTVTVAHQSAAVAAPRKDRSRAWLFAKP